MLNRFQLIAEALSSDPGTSATAEEITFWDPSTIIICTIGLSLMTVWLFCYDGPLALKKAPTRRNKVPFLLPIIFLFGWQMLMLAAVKLAESIAPNYPQYPKDLFQYTAMMIAQVTLIAIMLISASHTFCRRIKGFGLKLSTLPKDILAAFINLLTVYPLVILSLLTVIYLTGLFLPDYQMPDHQTLGLLKETGNLPLQIIIFLFSACIVPICEELLFRGFIQTTIQTATGSRWGAIIFSAAFFAIMHVPNYMHMPSLFFLACGLGYAYERSGSLFRPILMHIFFNGLSVGLTLIQVS